MKENNLKNTYFLAYGAAIAAIYVALTMAFQPISFGPVQFRISEALCILPFFTPAAIPGLFVGCFLSNLFCGAAGLDIVFGSLATLIGAVGSYALRKKQGFSMCTADPGQHDHCTVGAPVCIRL